MSQAFSAKRASSPIPPRMPFPCVIWSTSSTIALRSVHPILPCGGLRVGTFLEFIGVVELFSRRSKALGFVLKSVGEVFPPCCGFESGLCSAWRTARPSSSRPSRMKYNPRLARSRVRPGHSLSAGFWIAFAHHWNAVLDPVIQYPAHHDHPQRPRLLRAMRGSVDFINESSIGSAEAGCSSAIIV